MLTLSPFYRRCQTELKPCSAAGEHSVAALRRASSITAPRVLQRFTTSIVISVGAATDDDVTKRSIPDPYVWQSVVRRSLALLFTSSSPWCW